MGDTLSSSAQETARTQFERRALSATTWRLLPFLMLCYFVAYLGRINISFAAVHMNKDLGLSAAAYGLGAGLFFVTYFLCEIPSNLLLYKFGARRWIARIMLTWGLCAIGMAFINSETTFYIARLVFGAAEAGFYPGVLFYLTLWFPAQYRGRMMGLFLSAIPISSIIGAPLSGYLLSLDGLFGLHGWQIMFILEAVPAILLSPFVLVVLKDRPTEANWLSVEEQAWLTEKMAQESGSKKGHSASVWRALINPWVLFLALIYFTNVCLLNGITFFLPQIVASFGVDPLKAGFIIAIPNVSALVLMLIWGRHSDSRKERFGHVATANFLGGAALLTAMLLNDPTYRIAALSVALACTLAQTAPFWAIPNTFLSGAAVAGGIAAISSIGVTGGILAPWVVGITKDMTGDFRFGLGGLAILAMLVAVPTFILGRRKQAHDRIATQKPE